MSSAHVGTNGSARTGLGLLARAALQVRRLLCGLHGHDSLLHFEHGRLSLLCASCGYETPGWDLQSAPPGHRSRAAESMARPGRVVRLPLLGERRVA